VFTPSRAFVSRSSIRAFSLGDVIADINAEMLLWDLTLTEKDGYSKKYLILFETDHATVQAKIFLYESNYLLFHPCF